MDVLQAEQLFIEHSDWISRATKRAAARYGLSVDEVSDLEGLIRMRLIENDYARIRRYTGESTFTTYLVTLVAWDVAQLIRQTGGRWRSSATAMRLGPMAVQLEKLVYRDGYTLPQAIAKLQTSEESVPFERELLGLWAQLPQREGLRPSETDIDLFSGHTERTDTRVLQDETEQQRRILLNSLERALASLSEEDRLIIGFRFSQGLSVAEIARALRLEQKPLYRRVERLRALLRQQLEKEGVDETMVRALLPSDRDA